MMSWESEPVSQGSNELTVREARANLAQALLAADEPGQAEDQLWKALKAKGDRPPAWELRTHLGTVALRQGKASAALDHFLHALSEADEKPDDQPAALALALLDAENGTQLAQRADERLYNAVVDRSSGGDHHPVTLLAARLATLRGDLRQVGTIIEQGSDASSSDPTLRSAKLAAEVLARLERGDYQDAEDLLDKESGSSPDPTLLALHCLALYGLGRFEQAITLAASSSPQRDLSVAQAISYLALAAHTSGDERSHLLGAARDAAVIAARLDSSNPEPSLVRAQVLFEGDLDLDEGRRLLGSVVSRKSANPQGSLLWSLQAVTRNDDFYHYFAAELAAAENRPRDVIARVEQMNFAVTSHRQDGTARERMAEAYADVGDPEQAAEAYSLAAESFSYAGHEQHALGSLQAGLRMSFSTALALKVAEKCWQTTVDATSSDPSAAVGVLEDGLAVLDRVHDVTDDADLALASLLRGLLLSRLSELQEGGSENMWLAVPYMWLAVELRPEESYYAGHLSGALTECSLHRAADFYARRAYALSPDDAWHRARLVSCSANWGGSLDDEARELLETFRETNPSWYFALLCWHQMFSGVVDGLQEVMPLIDLDLLWADQIRAYATALSVSPEAGHAAFERLIKRAESESAFGVAAKASLRVDLPRFEFWLTRAEDSRLITPQRAELLRDFFRLISTDGAEGLSGLRAFVGNAVRPQRLRELLLVDIPTLQSAYPDAKGLTGALEGLSADVSARLQTLPSALLTSDIEAGEAWHSDEGVRDTTEALLRSVAARETRPPSSTLRAVQPGIRDPLSALALERLILTVSND